MSLFLTPKTLGEGEKEMASLSSYLPSPGKVSWRLDTTPSDVVEGNKVRHVMIRSAEVWEKPSPHVVSATNPFWMHEAEECHQRCMLSDYVSELRGRGGGMERG